MERIEADLLIPGSGEPVKNGAVVIDGSRIAFAGPAEDAPKTPGAIVHRVPVVMPGLWDAHGHFFGIRTGDILDVSRTPVEVMSARIVKDAERVLRAGFTSVREAGGWGIHLARVVAEGTVPGPHIYAAGSALSQTGGHGDFHSLPLEIITARLPSLRISYVCDGVPECLKAVRTQLRAGAKLIKVLASGGVMSELDHPVHQQFSDEEMRVIVAEAARADRIVAAHCHGKPGIVAALAAGCRTIEHGTYLDEEVAEMMLARDAVLVPTRFIIERLVKHAKPAGVPEYAQAKVHAIEGQHRKALGLAIRKGVRIALGTDIWMTGAEGMAPWGMNAQELVHLVEAGMRPLQAIEAATANGPATLGPQAPRSGQLKEGFDADVIAVAKDPLADIRVLTDPGNVTMVWKGGHLVKG